MADNKAKMAGLSANAPGVSEADVKPAPRIIKDKVEGGQGNTSNGATGSIHDYATPADRIRAGQSHPAKMPGLSSNGGSTQSKSC